MADAATRCDDRAAAVPAARSVTVQRAATGLDGLSMACWIEDRRPSADRKAAWHRDCTKPATCPCPAHTATPPAIAR